MNRNTAHHSFFVTLFRGTAVPAFLAGLMAIPTSADSADAHGGDLAQDPFVGVAQTNESALNDLIHRLPIISRRQEEELSGLSAVQEEIILHERLMQGEGLPERHRQFFAANYDAILTAIVDDRITMEYGRSLLCLHRQLIDRAVFWSRTPSPDKRYGDVIIMALEEVQEELGVNSQPLEMVPYCVRTPVVKGHLLWVEELLQWGAGCEVLSRGELGRLRLLSARLERFESYYKRDGHLSFRERELLHERLVDLNRALIDALRS